MNLGAGRGLSVVLVEPEIHFNTGNIGRTCVGAGARLHLVGKLGFSLDDKEIRRSGLDYWPRLDLRLHANFPAFLQAVEPEAPLFFFSAEAERDYWSAPFVPGSYLIFGKESVGLPRELRERHRDRCYRVPHSDAIRSLNLSTCAGVVLYEALRKASASVGAGG